MLHDELQGKHTPNNGEGLTLEDLYQLLKSIPAQARRETYLSMSYENGDQADVTGIALSQSDQAEKWEFKGRVLLGEPY